MASLIAKRITQHLIDKMFEYAHIPQTYEDIKDRENNFTSEFSMTMAQFAAFRDYAVRYLKRELKTSYYHAQAEFEWFNIMYGLSISDKAKTTSFEDLEE